MSVKVIDNDLRAIYSRLRKAANENDRSAFSEENLASLHSLVHERLEFSHRRYIINKIRRYAPQGPVENISLLDFGCGGGETLFLLHLYGFKRLFGVDINDQQRNQAMAVHLGDESPRFFQYQDRLPFDDGQFDFIISESVVEHLDDHYFPIYFSEMHRVLKSGGVAFVILPHRLMPYDSHTRLVFVHWLPEGLARWLRRRMGREPGNLFWRWRHQIMRQVRPLFGDVRDETAERLLSFKRDDLWHGGTITRRARLALDAMIRRGPLKGVMLRLTRALVTQDLILIKSAPARE
jgi:SAM-dependent methyltransferase